MEKTIKKKSYLKTIMIVVIAIAVILPATAMFLGKPAAEVYEGNTAEAGAIVISPNIDSHSSTDMFIFDNPSENKVGKGEDRLIRSFYGYWGITPDPEPLGTLSGNVLSTAATAQGELIDPWLCMKGIYNQHSKISIRFPLKDTNFQGYITFQGDTEEIMGSYWIGSDDETGILIAFFQWDEDWYWIYGDYKSIEV